MKSKRVGFILDNLSQKERDQFLEEILESKLAGKDISKIILSWEATAEINSITHVKDKILFRSGKLKQFLLQLLGASLFLNSMKGEER